MPSRFHLSTFMTIILLLGSLVLFARWSMRADAAVLTQATSPDLVITTITLNPANPGAGDTADIMVRVENQGNADARGFNVYLYIDPTENPPTQSTASTSQTSYNITLPPGGNFTWTRTDQLFTSDNPQIVAYVDPPWENQVAESNEDNNLYPPSSATPTSTATPPPVNTSTSTPMPTPSPSPTVTFTPTVGPDLFEPDNACADAKPITTDGVEQLRNFHRNPGPDQDWVKFEGKADVFYFIEAIAEGQDVDIELRLGDTCRTGPSFGGATITYLAPTDGTYYIQVINHPQDYGADNRYRLKITSDDGCVNDYEENDACSASGYLRIGETQNHAFCKPDDKDWVHFEVIGGRDYQVTTDNLGTKADAIITISDSCDQTRSTLAGATQKFTAPTSGIYYIQTENHNPNQFGAGAEYTLLVEEIMQNCTPDAFEIDNLQGEAKPLTPGASAQTHNICPANDADWVQFSATANTNYTIETLNLAVDSDTRLCLYNVASEELGCDDDSGAGKGSRLSWRAPATGTYFLRVKDNDAAVSGATTQYDLRILEGACIPDSHEPDNDRANANALAVDGTSHEHNICPQADVDWFSFTVNANSSYRVETTNLGPEADTVLELYDANGNSLAQNDDHSTDGSSLLDHTFIQAGTYYAKVSLNNSNDFGAGTEYSLVVRSGTSDPTPTSTLPPTATPTATPQASGIRTIILVNRTSIASLHGEESATQLINKLDELASHTDVQGQVLRLDRNDSVQQAYVAWEADPTSVEKANQVGSAIRRVIFNYLDQHGGVEYVVLVGEDRALPFWRIADATTVFPEDTYGQADATHPTGAALEANYYLSDDYFVDREPTLVDGREVYLPDLSIGRLIETPADMIGIIDAFLASPVTPVNGVLSSGYDFVQDLADDVCQTWQTDLGNNNLVNCTLIGDQQTGNAWTANELRIAQVETTPSYKIQSISGHADHYREGAPDQGTVKAHEIAASAVDLRGGLIYTPGCHAGLNLPPSNSNNPIDLPQAFASKGANYVGHTGYGWGHVYDIGWSEKLIQLYTRALVEGPQSSMGKALTLAKQTYYQQRPDLDLFDIKILETMIFYGLPMFEIETGAVLSLPEEEFPGVTVEESSTVRAAQNGASTLEVSEKHLNFSEAIDTEIGFSKIEKEEGSYYALGRSLNTAKSPSKPITPLHFYTVKESNGKPGRGVVIRNASFHVRTNFDALNALPYTDFPNRDQEPIWQEDENEQAWHPPVISTVQNEGEQSTVVTQIGQYHRATEKLRIYRTVSVDIFHSDSDDETVPEIHLLAARYDNAGRINVKVGASDASGIHTVFVSYIENINLEDNMVQSLELNSDPDTQMWEGNFAGNGDTRFFVQAVDNAGNVAVDHNKGLYHQPVVQSAVSSSSVELFLPVVSR